MPVLTVVSSGYYGSYHPDATSLSHPNSVHHG